MSTHVSWSSAERNLPAKQQIPLWDITLSILTVVGFVAGVAACCRWPIIGSYADQVMNGVVSTYSYLAPAVIFCILAPSLHQVLSLTEHKHLIVNSFFWLARKRLLSCLFGVVFTTFIFGLQLLPNHSVNCLDTLFKTLENLGYLATHSPYFIALYISIASAFVALRIEWLKNIFERLVNGIETLGTFFSYAVPVLMFCMGAYVYQLPEHLKASLPSQAVSQGTLALSWLGGSTQLGTPSGAVKVYFLIGALVGLACLLFHFATVVVARFSISGFSIRGYFMRYWFKVYPLLWATSSESLSTPLNLSLVRNIYPQVSPLLRRFVVGMGSWLNINGTLICVFIMAGAIAKMLGQNVSLLELVLAIPAVFLIGYGVPGMPGELILFAAPMAKLIGISPELTPLFIALYIGFNFGLADAFRSGHNSTDNCLSALMLSTREVSLATPILAEPARIPMRLAGAGEFLPNAVDTRDLLSMSSGRTPD
ncbi:MAG: cation:dicarboxylase symporter family transporter [Candidatus Melainabacteria bacterium]|nr:cation:dicarboxylase symporter family transporter [Candidatus Melainabacteria bacterium]